MARRLSRSWRILSTLEGMDRNESERDARQIAGEPLVELRAHGGTGHTIGLFDFRDLGLLPLFALALPRFELLHLPPVVLQDAGVALVDRLPPFVRIET